MSFVQTNGIRLAYQRSGAGECVLFIMGSGAGGRVWTMYQTPALNEVGYQTVTFDNRGIAPSDVPPGRYALGDLLADTRGLIEALELGPCRIVGTSMGAWIAEELAIQHPELVSSAVLIATRARSDAFRRALVASDRLLAEGGVQLPAPYAAAMSVLQMLSPATLRDDSLVTPMLDLFELSDRGNRANRGQSWIETPANRIEQLGRITVPCRVISFSDDIVTPPHLATEVAEAIPDCDLIEIGGAGHLGFLEQPDEVNRAIVEFFDKHPSTGATDRTTDGVTAPRASA